MMGVKRKKVETKKAAKKREKASAATESKGFGAAPPAPPPSDQLPQEPQMEGVAQASGAANAASEGPPDASSPPGCEKVFALASAERFSSLRVGSLDAPPTYAAIYEGLRDAAAVGEEGEGGVAAFVEANRDLLDYRFLYQLTGEKLRAENTGNTAAADALAGVRALAVRHCQRFDAALFRQVAVAENALGGLLAQFMQGKTPSDASVLAAAKGNGPQATFAFWMVLLAAMAAWEAKLPVEGVGEQAKAKLAELQTLRVALEGDAALMEAGGIAPLQALFELPDMSMQLGYSMVGKAEHEAARAKLAEVAPDAVDRLLVLRRVGCVACQAQRHGFQAYNPMTQRAAALHDILLHGALQPLSSVDIQAPERTSYSSRMIKMARDAQPFLDDQNLEIPLFW